MIEDRQRKRKHLDMGERKEAIKKRETKDER